MNQVKTITGNLLIPVAHENIFVGSQVRTNYLWKNLITEKRASFNLIDKLYKASPLYAFWNVLSSPVE